MTEQSTFPISHEDFPPTANGSVRIRAILKMPGDSAGQFNRQLEFFTDHPKQFQLRIPVAAFVVKPTP